VEKSQAELEARVLEEASRRHGAGHSDLHIEIIKMLGKLKFRTSYGQNVLSHSKEVARLAEILAKETGANPSSPSGPGSCTTSGKAIDREMEGTHIQLGWISCGASGNRRPSSMPWNATTATWNLGWWRAVLITIADALSAARPGARRDVLESYVRRLEKLEEIAGGFQGVSKAYACRPGAKLRIIVESQKISDEQSSGSPRISRARSRGRCSTPARSRSPSSGRPAPWIMRSSFSGSRFQVQVPCCRPAALSCVGFIWGGGEPET